MAKTTPLTPEYMNAASTAAPLPVRPLAGTGTATKRPPKAPKNDGLIQVRCTKEQEKAIKRAALDADKSISAYILDSLKL